MLYLNPHLPYGRWPRQAQNRHFDSIFQSTPSLRKVTWYVNALDVRQRISIHTFLTEGDIRPQKQNYGLLLFQSTPSLRKVTLDLHGVAWVSPISIHTFLTEGDGNGNWTYLASNKISIHTFLTEGDFSTAIFTQQPRDFNPHLPYGRWLSHFLHSQTDHVFQSTPSLRKVTGNNLQDIG